VDNESLVITSPDEDEEDSASNRSQFSNVVLRIITYPLLGIITSPPKTTYRGLFPPPPLHLSLVCGTHPAFTFPCVSGFPPPGGGGAFPPPLTISFSFYTSSVVVETLVIIPLRKNKCTFSPLNKYFRILQEILPSKEVYIPVHLISFKIDV
jgi:hypothetical protein